MRIINQTVIKSGCYPFKLPLPLDVGEVWKPHPIFQGSTATLNYLSCHASTLAPGFSPHAPHEHSDEEILIVLSGEIDIILKDHHASAQPGFYRKRLQKYDFVFYPANFAHSLETISEPPANYLMFRWRGLSSFRNAMLDFRLFNALPARDETGVDQRLSMQLMFEEPTRYLGKLHCHATSLASGSGYEPHVDPYDVAILLLEGEVRTLGQIIKAPGVIFYEAGKPHGISNPADCTAKYLVFEFHRHSAEQLQKSSGFKRDGMIKPSFIMLDASSACQLKCPSCPTGQGMTLKTLGAKFLKFTDFKKLIDANPWIKTIELSNWGEILLNPEITAILEYGFKKNVALQANCGVNLNTASSDVLEALVKYQLRSMTVALDGASNETYKIYRVGGDFERVIAHIRTINAFKQRYKTDLPKLTWQFIAFGHNEHETEKAKNMAAELKMDFRVKLSFGDLYTGKTFSPVRNRDLIRRESGIDCADRQEYFEKHGAHYLQKVSCGQLWDPPQIHADGRLLGCSINYKLDYGNVFEDGLLECLNNEKINYARQMLMGLKPPREDIPCSTCFFYQTKRSYVDYDSISHVHDILADREAQIAAIYSSTSWRMTRPLRFAGDKVKKYMHLMPIPARRLSGRKEPQQVSAENDIGQLTHLGQAISAREAQIAAIYHSTSWRVTRPLRFAGGKVKIFKHLLPIPAQRLARQIYKLFLYRKST
ncbi:MAG: cupin domain-containing protein [Smithella sp.]|nr:cupin domain-containing protein [Smithella sp.]